MSLLFTLKGVSSTLSIDFVNPLQLSNENTYGLALVGFHSYNSIPNIEEGRNNKFYYFENGDTSKERVITIPTGSYEISDIENLINIHVPKIKDSEGVKINSISIKPNNNTIKCEVFSSVHSINFTHPDSIGYILGFSAKVLEVNKTHASDLPVNIVKVRTIHIDSNISVGAFYNDRPSHTIYEFAVSVDPGFAINETPKHLIYLPVNKTEIYNITLRILDQNFEPVNFRGEEIIIRLELKQQQAS